MCCNYVLMQKIFSFFKFKSEVICITVSFTKKSFFETAREFADDYWHFIVITKNSDSFHSVMLQSVRDVVFQQSLLYWSQQYITQLNKSNAI